MSTLFIRSFNTNLEVSLAPLSISSFQLRFTCLLLRITRKACAVLLSRISDVSNLQSLFTYPSLLSLRITQQNQSEKILVLLVHYKLPNYLMPRKHLSLVCSHNVFGFPYFLFSLYATDSIAYPFDGITLLWNNEHIIYTLATI